MDNHTLPDGSTRAVRSWSRSFVPAAGPTEAIGRGSLPYGAVMATAGASVLAGRCGLQVLVAPLLALAVAQALWVPCAGAWRHRRGFGSQCRAWCNVGAAHRHTGIHTVPLGLAVIAGGLATLAAGGAGPWSWILACAGLGITWLLTLVYVGRFGWSLAFRDVALHTVDGAWFLVPAALLGAGIAAAAVAPLVSGNAATVLGALALAAVLLGWFGYLAVACAALLRVWRHGLGGVPQAPWWIAMGCAGLAAAALGVVLPSAAKLVWLHRWLRDAMATTVVVAIVLCVPVLIGGAVFLLRHCRFRGAAAWPPTFSTAVFALGCLAAGSALHSSVLRSIGLGAGYATLLFWTVTMAWNTWCACASPRTRRLLQPHTPGSMRCKTRSRRMK